MTFNLFFIEIQLNTWKMNWKCVCWCNLNVEKTAHSHSKHDPISMINFKNVGKWTYIVCMNAGLLFTNSPQTDWNTEDVVNLCFISKQSIVQTSTKYTAQAHHWPISVQHYMHSPYISGMCVCVYLSLHSSLCLCSNLSLAVVCVLAWKIACIKHFRHIQNA